MFFLSIIWPAFSYKVISLLQKSVGDLLDPPCETQFWQYQHKVWYIWRYALAKEAGNANLAMINVIKRVYFLLPKLIELKELA